MDCRISKCTMAYKVAMSFRPTELQYLHRNAMMKYKEMVNL